MVLTKCMICPSNKYKTVYNPYSLIRVFLSELFQRQHRHFKSGQATANKSACARVGGVYSRQCAAVKTTCGIKMRGCRCSPVAIGPCRLLIHRQKGRNDYEKRVHAGQRRAWVGHLAQSSRSRTVSAV